MLLLLPFKATWYVVLLSRFATALSHCVTCRAEPDESLRIRLVVVSVGVSAGLLEGAWLVEMSIAVALSFVVSAMVNGRGHLMVEKIAARLPAQDEGALNPEERHGDAGDAEVVVIGMGRVGFAAYQRLTDHYGLRVVGVDYDGTPDRTVSGEGPASDRRRRHRPVLLEPTGTLRLGAHCHLGHAASRRQRHRAGMPARVGFSGKVAAVARYDDEVQWAKDHGVGIAFNVYAGAGLGWPTSGRRWAVEGWAA